VLGAVVEAAAVVAVVLVTVAEVAGGTVVAAVPEAPGSSTQPQGPCSLQGHCPAATYLHASLHLASVAPLRPAVKSRLARQTLIGPPVPPQVCVVVTVALVVVAIVVVAGVTVVVPT